MPHESNKIILERLQREPQGGRPFGGMTDKERALRNQQRLREMLADDTGDNPESDADMDW